MTALDLCFLCDHARTSKTCRVFPMPLPILPGLRNQPVVAVIGGDEPHGADKEKTNEEIVSDFGGSLAAGHCSLRSDDAYDHRHGRSNRPDRAAVPHQDQ